MYALTQAGIGKEIQAEYDAAVQQALEIKRRVPAGDDGHCSAQHEGYDDVHCIDE